MLRKATRAKPLRRGLRCAPRKAQLLRCSDQNLTTMLRWVLTFLLVAIVAGIFGFTGIAAGAAEIAKIIFYVFLILLVLALIFGGSIWKKVS